MGYINDLKNTVCI